MVLFEGIITEVTSDSIWVDLVDVFNSEMPREFAEIELVKIPESERVFVAEGAVFYWYITEADSYITFLKDSWDKEQTASIIEEGKKMFERFCGI